MKFLKWLLIVVVVLVVLVVAAVGLLRVMVDPEQIKQEVATRFEQQTGHSLTIDAPVKWSVFPWLGLHLEKVAIGNAPGFGKQPLASVGVLDVKVGLKPLMEKRIAVDTVVLKGVKLNLVRNAKGVANWESLVGGKAKKVNHAEVEKGKNDQLDQYSIDLKGVDVEDIDLSYLDKAAGQSYRLHDLHLHLGEVKPGKPVKVRLGGGATVGKPAVELKLDASTRGTFSRDFKRIQLADLVVKLAGQGDELPKGGIELKLAGNMSLDQAAGKLKVSNLSISGPQVDVTGALDISGLNQKPRVEGQLALRQTNLKSLLKLAGVNIQTADPKALTRLSAKLSLVQKGGALTIDPLKLVLDNTHLNGRLAIPSFTGPVVRARLQADTIDLDRYLPPKEKKPTVGSAPASASVNSSGKTASAKVDFTPLRKLDADVSVAVGKLSVNHLHMKKVTLRLVAKKGVVTLSPVNALLYHGRLNAKASMNVRGSKPVIQAGSSLVGIRIGPLLADLTGKDKLTGTGNVKFSLHTRGLGDLEIRRNLNGNFSLSLRDGAYKGFDLAQVIREAKMALKGQRPAPTSKVPETDFAELRGTGVIHNGVVSNKDLYLASPILRVKGNGLVDLVKEQMDYHVMAKLVGSLKGQGGKSMEELRGIPIPVRVTGPLSDPSPKVDAEALVKGVAKKKIEEKKQELLKKAGEKLQNQIGGSVLRGLFGR